MRILALEFQYTHSVGCLCETTPKDKPARWRFLVAPTSPKSMLQLLSNARPDRLVMELSVRSIWAVNLAESMDVKVQFANMDTTEKLQHRRGIDFRNVMDLARLSAQQELPVIDLSDQDLEELKALFLVRHELSHKIKAISIATEMLQNLPDDKLHNDYRLKRDIGIGTSFTNRIWIQK